MSILLISYYQYISNVLTFWGKCRSHHGLWGTRAINNTDSPGEVSLRHTSQLPHRVKDSIVVFIRHPEFESVATKCFQMSCSNTQSIVQYGVYHFYYQFPSDREISTVAQSLRQSLQLLHKDEQCALCLSIGQTVASTQQYDDTFLKKCFVKNLF